MFPISLKFVIVFLGTVGGFKLYLFCSHVLLHCQDIDHVFQILAAISLQSNQTIMTCHFAYDAYDNTGHTNLLMFWNPEEFSKDIQEAPVNIFLEHKYWLLLKVFMHKLQIILKCVE